MTTVDLPTASAPVPRRRRAVRLDSTARCAGPGMTTRPVRMHLGDMGFTNAVYEVVLR